MLYYLLAAPGQHLLASRLIRASISAIVLIIIGEFIFTIACAIIAKIKGYSAILFGILGFFFSIVTLIIVLLLPRRRRR